MHDSGLARAAEATLATGGALLGGDSVKLTDSFMRSECLLNLVTDLLLLLDPSSIFHFKRFMILSVFCHFRGFKKF